MCPSKKRYSQRCRPRRLSPSSRFSHRELPNAQTVVGADLEGATPVGSSPDGLRTGPAFNVRVGYKLGIPLLALTPEVGYGYTRLSGHDGYPSFDMNRLFLGARLGFGGVLVLLDLRASRLRLRRHRQREHDAGHVELRQWRLPRRWLRAGPPGHPARRHRRSRGLFRDRLVAHVDRLGELWRASRRHVLDLSDRSSIR